MLRPPKPTPAYFYAGDSRMKSTVTRSTVLYVRYVLELELYTYWSTYTCSAKITPIKLLGTGTRILYGSHRRMTHRSRTF